MYRQIGRWPDGHTEEHTDEEMKAQVKGLTIGQTDRLMGAQKDIQTDKETNRR
jgi:hypothetical protein